MDILHGKTLLRKSGGDFVEVRADEELTDVDVIGFYFSAHWCFPCLAFTPRLATCYKQLKENRQAFEIVFVSADLSDEMMKSYMQESHGDWLAVLPGDELTEELTEKYGVMGVPALVIAKKNGEIITMKGPRDVRIKGSEAFKSWKEGKPATTDDDEIEDTKEKEKAAAAAAEPGVAKKAEGAPGAPKKKKPKSKDEGPSHEPMGDEEGKKTKKTKKKVKVRKTEEGEQSVDAESVALSPEEETGKVKKKKKVVPKEEVESATALADEGGEFPLCERPVKKKIKRRKKPEEVAREEGGSGAEGGVGISEVEEAESKPKPEKKKRKKISSEEGTSTTSGIEEEGKAEAAGPKKKRIVKKKKTTHGDQVKVEKIKEENEIEDPTTPKTLPSVQGGRLATQQRLEEELRRKDETIDIRTPSTPTFEDMATTKV